MVSYVWKVKHGCCAKCGAESAELFTIDIQAGKPIKIGALAKGTHAGLCNDCIYEIGASVNRWLSDRIVEKDSE